MGLAEFKIAQTCEATFESTWQCSCYFNQGRVLLQESGKKRAEVRKWENIIAHFLIYPNIKKRKIKKLFFFFSFLFYKTIFSLLEYYS